MKSIEIVFIAILIMALIFAYVFLLGWCGEAETTSTSGEIHPPAEDAPKIWNAARYKKITTEYLGPIKSVSVTIPEPSEQFLLSVSAEEHSYSDEDLGILANTIYYEANGCTDRHQQLVAAVVLNRVADPRWPGTVREVVSQKVNGYWQYGTGRYADKAPIQDFAEGEMIRCFENAREALEGNVNCPENVLYQAEFIQGTGAYEVITSPWGSVTYFCYEAGDAR